MPIKDSVVRWYIQNVIIPRHEVIDNPGFIIDQFSDKASRVYLREIALPERFMENLEKQVVERYGDDGRKALYSAGKKFGYSYSQMSNFWTIKTASEKDIKKLVYAFVRFVECTWANKITHTINVPKKEARIEFEEYVICRNNGIGHVVTEGTCTGFWAYLMSDPNIEGVQTKCQGRGDKKCVLVCGPPESLSERKLRFFRETDMSGFEKDNRYDTVNKIRPTKYAQNSFKRLVDSGFLNYKRGIVERNGERYFLVENGLIYILERELQKLKSGKALVFETAFDFGRRIAEMEKDKDFGKFITDFMSALGWGDIAVINKGGRYAVISSCFPWTRLSEETEFSVYRGILSGIISASTGRGVSLDKIEKNLTSNGFNLILSES